MFELLLVAVGGGGLGATIVGVLNALLGRKKISADATRIIEESASSAVQRVEADNARLRKRVEKIEGLLEEFRSGLRTRDRRIDELSDEVDDWREYTFQLRNELQRQDPTLSLPEPPPRIARHFLPP